MKDGDRKNADLASNGRDTVNSYNNAYYVKLKSAYPIRLYNKEGLECKARANNGAYVKDAQGCDAYYLPGIEHSKINVQLRFNVGISTQGRPFAKPYPNWIQQCVEGTSTGSFTGPAAWTGSSAQTQPQATAYNPQTAPMPTQVQPQAQAYQRPVGTIVTSTWRSLRSISPSPLPLWGWVRVGSAISMRWRARRCWACPIRGNPASSSLSDSLRRIVCRRKTERICRK